jgi:RNA polymerase subunit RPABC4/transcription elongation factor Spt4
MAEGIESKVCPSCAETIKAAAKVCPFCRSKLDRWAHYRELLIAAPGLIVAVAAIAAVLWRDPG